MPAFTVMATINTGDTIQASDPNTLYNNTKHLWDREEAMDTTVAALDTRIDALEGAAVYKQQYDDSVLSNLTAFALTTAYVATDATITASATKTNAMVAASVRFDIRSATLSAQSGIAKVHLNGSPVGPDIELGVPSEAGGIPTQDTIGSVSAVFTLSFSASDVIDIRVKKTSSSSSSYCTRAILVLRD